MKVTESEDQVDEYGRIYIKFTGVKKLQALQITLRLYGTTIKLCFICTPVDIV